MKLVGITCAHLWTELGFYRATILKSQHDFNLKELVLKIKHISINMIKSLNISEQKPFHTILMFKSLLWLFPVNKNIQKKYLQLKQILKYHK